MKMQNLLAAAALALAAYPGSAQAQGVGTVVSDATFRLATGEQHSFAEMRGQVVVLTYWMRDCKACDNQLKILDRYYRQRHNVGLRVFAIPVEELSDGKIQHAFKGKIVHPLSQIRGPFEMRGLPTTYVIDRYGQIRFSSSELLDTDELNRILVPLLRQPQP